MDVNEDRPKDYDYKSNVDSSSNNNIKGNRKSIKGKIIEGISSTIDKSEEDTNLSESARISNNVRRILLGLFILIGFIILVFAIFTASVSPELVQIANSVFIAAIVGSFTLVGVIVYHIRGSRENK
jgi:Fe2+ transport system protein B